MHKPENIRTTITYLANCALYICFEADGGALPFSLLIDGIYDENEFFSPPDPGILAAAEGARNALSDIPYLLFTHRHRDHFQGDTTERYILHNKVSALYLPICHGAFYEDPHPMSIAARRGLLHTVSLAQDTVGPVDLTDGISFSYVSLEHADPSTYGSIVHGGILLEAGTRRILIGADMNDSEVNADILQAIGPLDMIFVTPIFLRLDRGWEIIHQLQALQPDRPLQTVMYHLPFPAYDRSGLLPLMRRILRQHPSEEERLLVLTEHGQTIIL